jgi:hypothetical protein
MYYNMCALVTSLENAPWLLFMFTLSAKRASQRVDVWRRVRRYGALAIRNSGYVLPASPANLERLQWLAREVRRHNGQATIVQAQSFDDLPSAELMRRFAQERSREYAVLVKELDRAVKKSAPTRALLARIRKRFQDVVDRDYFACPARTKVEALLARAEQGPSDENCFEAAPG